MNPQEVRVITRLAICGAFSGRYTQAGGPGSGPRPGDGTKSGKKNLLGYASTREANVAVAQAQKDIAKAKQDLDTAMNREITENPQIAQLQNRLTELDAEKAEINRKADEKKAAIAKKYEAKRAADEAEFQRKMKEAGL